MGAGWAQRRRGEQQNQPEPADGRQQEQDGDEQDPQQESPLPQFRDLPDMSAEEAAAILEATLNMEREQRRRKALQSASQHRRGKKDW